MFRDFLDFIIRNQSISFVIGGAIISGLLYWILGTRIVRLIRILWPTTKTETEIQIGLGHIPEDLFALFNFSAHLLGYHLASEHNRNVIIKFASKLNFKVPFRYFKTTLIGILIFVLGFIFFPLAVGGYAAVRDVKYMNVTKLLDPPSAIGPLHPNARVAIVLFHGWTGEPNATWDSFSNLLASDNDLADVDIWPANYPTYISRTHLNISQISSWVYEDFVLSYSTS